MQVLMVYSRIPSLYIVFLLIFIAFWTAQI